jgi:Spy/CpxP family protein refolding chaperone
MSPRIKGTLLLLVAFGLGVAGGAAGFGLYKARVGWWRPPDPAQFQQRVLGRLTKELDLRPDQQQQVEAILKETGQEFVRLREELSPRFRDIRTRARDRIRSVLDAGQQAKFEVVAREWERRVERWRGRGTGPDGGAGKAP